jgi:hypothetical protein
MKLEPKSQRKRNVQTSHKKTTETAKGDKKKKKKMTVTFISISPHTHYSCAIQVSKGVSLSVCVYSRSHFPPRSNNGGLCR